MIYKVLFVDGKTVKLDEISHVSFSHREYESYVCFVSKRHGHVALQCKPSEIAKIEAR